MESESSDSLVDNQQEMALITNDDELAGKFVFICKSRQRLNFGKMQPGKMTAGKMRV